MSPLLPRTFLFAAAALGVSLRVLAHSAVDPAPRLDDGWKRRQATLNTNAAAAGAKAKVIFIGDSITQGWEGEGREVWARYYAHRGAVNLGIGGDRTQHVLWRLDNGNLEGLSPKAAVVMIGTNNSNGEDNSVDQIAEGVTAIVRRLREKLPGTKVLLLGIFPRSENPSPQRGKVLQVNQVLQKLGDDRDVFYLDFGHRFLDASGRIPRDLMPDYLHLSPKAYGIWADAIEARLASILGDTAVTPDAAAAGKAGASLSGEWVITIPGPNQEPIDMPFLLKQDGNTVTGAFDRPDGRKLEIQNGRVDGQTVRWTMKRDRPGGSSMTYEMTGTVDGAAMTGKATTEMEGNPVTIAWKAKRR